MSLDTNPKPYGLSDIKLTSIDGVTQVDLPAATKLSFKERIKSAEGVGDDNLSTVVAVREGIEWELEATGLPLEALALMYGITTSTSGTTPDQIKTLTAAGAVRLPYFKIYGKSLGEGDDDVHCIIYKAKVTEDVDVGIPSPDSVNFVDFVTRVDGGRIEANVELKSNVQGIDKTEVLRRLGMPLNPYQASSVINDASASVLDQMRYESLLDENNQPLWKLKTVFYWQQTFPKDRTIEISHRYKPIAGGSVMTSIHQIPTNSDMREAYKKYCVEPSLIDTVNRSIKPGEDYPRFGELIVEYILTTGANWASPIRRFRLVVDKGSPRNLVSFCAQGVTKVGPARFEIIATGLEILFERNTKSGRLHFTTNLAEGIKDAQIIFLALPTPPGADGSADL